MQATHCVARYERYSKLEDKDPAELEEMLSVRSE